MPSRGRSVFGHLFEFRVLRAMATSNPERSRGDFGRTVPPPEMSCPCLGIEEATTLLASWPVKQVNRIGFVGGIELPPIKRGYQGWLRGAQSVNPRVDSRLAYLNTFDDVAAGREAALAMIRLGVDVLHHNADQAALGLFQAVKESPGVYAIGANADQSVLAPDNVLGSVVIDLPRAFLAIAREVKGGNFKPKVEGFGLAGGVVRYDPNPRLKDRVPAALDARVKAASDSIVAGTPAYGTRKTPRSRSRIAGSWTISPLREVLTNERSNGIRCSNRSGHVGGMCAGCIDGHHSRRKEALHRR